MHKAQLKPFLSGTMERRKQGPGPAQAPPQHHCVDLVHAQGAPPNVSLRDHGKTWLDVPDTPATPFNQ